MIFMPRHMITWIEKGLLRKKQGLYDIFNFFQVEYGALVTKLNKYGETPLEKCQGHLAKKLQGDSTLYCLPTFNYI